MPLTLGQLEREGIIAPGAGQAAAGEDSGLEVYGGEDVFAPSYGIGPPGVEIGPGMGPEYQPEEFEPVEPPEDEGYTEAAGPGLYDDFDLPPEGGAMVQETGAGVPAEYLEEETVWDKYKVPIIIGGSVAAGALILYLIFRSKE